MRFLVARTDPAAIATVLLVQTCNPDLLGHVARAVRRRFPQAKLTVLVQRGMTPYLPPLPVDEQIENVAEQKRETMRQLRARRFDAVCFIESGEKGFWKLKLLPFFLSPKAIWLYDRLARPTPMSFSAALAYLLTPLTAARSPITARRLAVPVTFYRLWRFYRRRTSR